MLALVLYKNKSEETVVSPVHPEKALVNQVADVHAEKVEAGIEVSLVHP